VRGLIRSPDRWVAAGFAAGTVVEALWRAGDRPAWLAIDLLGALTMGLLVLRRRRPLAALSLYVAAAAAGTIVQSRLPGPTAGTSLVPIVALLLLMFSLGRYGGRRAVLLGAPQPIVLVLLVDLVDPTAGSVVTGGAFFSVFVVALPLLAGRLVRSRQRLVARLHAQEAQLAAAHDARLSSARAEEWLAVSDRLHDSVELGLEALVDRVRRLRERGDGDPDLIESSARSLLAQTRDAVVSLSQPARVLEPPVRESQAREAPTRASGSRPPGARLDEAVMPWSVLAAAGVGIGLLVETRPSWSGPLPEPVVLMLCGVLIGAMAATCRWPLPATAVVWVTSGAVATVVTPLDGTLTGAAVMFTTPFLVGLLESRRRASAGLAVCVAGGWVTLGTGEVVASSVVATLAWSAGRLLRDHVRLVEEVRSNHEELAGRRDEQLRDIVLSERGRIAPELHDAVGHTLTVVALQAGAARRMWRTDRQRSLDALATIDRVARSGLAELREGFGGGSADVSSLVGDARAAGLVVDLDDSTALPDQLRPVVFRVVQEGLTNAIKHSPGSSVRIRMVPAPDGFEVLVENGPGDGSPASTAGSRGLAGMRSRVEATGGRLEWGTTSEGGFRLHARFRAVVPA
jgi:signal transduction histidine kinase